MRGVIDLLIARTIEKLSERLSYLEKKDKELRKSVYMVDGRVRVPDDELDELRTELACLNARQDDIVKRMNHFTNRGPDDPMSHLQSVRNANSRLAERIEDLDKREARLVERVIAIEGNQGPDEQRGYWREQIQTLQGTVNRLETIIKQLFGHDLDVLARSTQIETVFDRLNQLSRKVAESQKTVETHWLDDQRALASFQEELAELGKTLEATAEGQARELAAFREHVNRHYAEWTERLDRLAENFETVTNSLETVTEGQARELEVLRNHVNTQVSKLAHEDSVFHDFVTAFRGRLENLDKSVSSINEYRIRDTTELKEIVKKLSTRRQRLP